MPTFIKAGFWEKLCKSCNGYKGWLNLDEFITNIVTSLIPPVPTSTYKVYTALLTQSGTNAPVATVLQNTLGGAVTWNRTFIPPDPFPPGQTLYYATSSGLFTVNKTTILCGGVVGKFGSAFVGIDGNPYTVFGNSQELDTTNYVTVEIRVYN